MPAGKGKRTRVGQKDVAETAKKARVIDVDAASSSSSAPVAKASVEDAARAVEACDKIVDPGWSGISDPEIVEAANVADIDRVFELMKEVSPSDQDKLAGHSALHVASGLVKWEHKQVANRAEMIKRMLEHDDCDPNIQDNFQMTPLHWCAWITRPKIDLIITAMCTPRMHSKTGKADNMIQIDPNIQDCRGDTPLMIACRSSNHHAIKPLLAVGADPNIFNNLGYVPLHYACHTGNEKTVQALLESYEVEVNLQAKGSDSTALHFAQQDFDKAGKTEVFKMLLKKGANPDMADISGRSVALIASTLKLNSAGNMKKLLKDVQTVPDTSKRLCSLCKNQLTQKMFKYMDWVIKEDLISCVACEATKAREGSDDTPLYIQVDPTKLASITYTSTQRIPDDFAAFKKKKNQKADKDRDNFKYHSEKGAGTAAFMHQAQFGDKPHRLDPNLDEVMDVESMRALILQVGGNPITGGKFARFNGKSEAQRQLEHLVYRPCIGYRDERLEVLEIHDPANPASVYSSDAKPCYGLFLKKNAKPIKIGTILGEYAGTVQDSSRLSTTLTNVTNEDEEADPENSTLDEEYLMTLETTLDAKYYSSYAKTKGSYAVVNAREFRNEMGFINDFRGVQEPGRDERTADRQKNVEFRDVVIDNWPRLFAVAMKEITPGTEILVDYGEDYWVTQNGTRQDHFKMNTKVARAKWVGELKEMSRSIALLEGLVEHPELPAHIQAEYEEKLALMKDHQGKLMKQANVTAMDQLPRLESNLTGNKA